MAFTSFSESGFSHTQWPYWVEIQLSFLSICQLLVFPVLWVAWFYFLGNKYCVILVVMCGKKTEQSSWVLCLLNFCSGFLWMLKAVILGNQILLWLWFLCVQLHKLFFQAGYVSRSVHSACYWSLFLGLGGFKVICGKESCRNGKTTWKRVAYFLFFNAIPCFSMQTLMFGYATDETKECMPLTVLLVHRLTASYGVRLWNGMEHGPGLDQMGKHRFIM